MATTIQFLRRVILLVLILTILCPVLVLGQDPTTREPAPDPTTREPAPDPTTREPAPDPTTREPEPDPTTREPEPDPTTREDPTTTEEPTVDPATETPTRTTEIITTTDEPTTTTMPPSTETTPSSTTSITTTATSPVTSDPECPQNCLAQAASTVGCSNYGDLACVCPKLDSYLSAANTCMQSRQCDPSLSSRTLEEQRSACSSNPPSSSTSTNTAPTVGTQGGPAQGGRLTTQTQTFTLTPGQVVTFGLSGTQLTTFTARSSLTTTRIATMLEQFGSGGNGGDGSSGSGSGAIGLRIGCELSVAIGVVGMMVGAVLVL